MHHQSHTLASLLGTRKHMAKSSRALGHRVIEFEMRGGDRGKSIESVKVVEGVEAEFESTCPVRHS